VKTSKKGLFPKLIYVTHEGDEDPYLSADSVLDSFDADKKVAIYELREVKTKRVDHWLE
jgi:hypothetical protein